MYVDNEKTILVDADGVLLDWVYSFRGWMDRHGYMITDPNEYRMDKAYGLDEKEGKKLCRMFNESATIRKIPPLRDAVKYIRKLHEEQGYVFRVISSLSNDEYAHRLRTKNLIELFGPTVFESFVYLDTGADKDEALAPYADSGCLWIEDKPENAVCGHKFGLDSVLMSHPHNVDFEHPFVTRVNNWKEIYEMLV
jgi:FMN phosphatase YigB (HAD superfamily)